MSNEIYNQVTYLINQALNENKRCFDKIGTIGSQNIDDIHILVKDFIIDNLSKNILPFQKLDLYHVYMFIIHDHNLYKIFYKFIPDIPLYRIPYSVNGIVESFWKIESCDDGAIEYLQDFIDSWDYKFTKYSIDKLKKIYRRENTDGCIFKYKYQLIYEIKHLFTLKICKSIHASHPYFLKFMEILNFLKGTKIES